MTLLITIRNGIGVCGGGWLVIIDISWIFLGCIRRWMWTHWWWCISIIFIVYFLLYDSINCRRGVAVALLTLDIICMSAFFCIWGEIWLIFFLFLLWMEFFFKFFCFAFTMQSVSWLCVYCVSGTDLPWLVRPWSHRFASTITNTFTFELIFVLVLLLIVFFFWKMEFWKCFVFIVRSYSFRKPISYPLDESRKKIYTKNSLNQN